MKNIVDKLEHAVYLIEDPYTIGVLREAIEAIEKLQAEAKAPCPGCQDLRRHQRAAEESSWENERLRAEGAYDQGRDGWS